MPSFVKALSCVSSIEYAILSKGGTWREIRAFHGGQCDQGTNSATLGLELRQLAVHLWDREAGNKKTVTAGRARQSSARRSVACGGAQRTDAPYRRELGLPSCQAILTNTLACSLLDRLC